MDNIYSSIYPKGNSYKKILLLTEGRELDYFGKFRKDCNIGKQSEYRFEPTQEDCSLILKKNDEDICYILAGRQIVTRERLEVLSVASSQKLEDGLPIEEVIERILNKKGIAVLAWGVGKWFFKRGKIIKYLLERYNNSPNLFIGDNSSRPIFWSVPKLYNLAEQLNIGILRGSDPLPFNGEYNRVGTYGFIIEGSFKGCNPAESFRNILSSNKKDIYLFGQQDRLDLFIRRQSKILFKKYIIG